ncbi:MAG TPA: hypothetical protein VG370_20085 [Chloroflexota bacterium]|jgi:hypothetical protein|nr:hypothetical protein [Chloroflexota bacterium]
MRLHTVIVLRPVLFVAVAALLMCGGCSGPDALPTREAAIRRATADAERSWPEFSPVTSRIDGSAAELVTLEEARRRMGWSGSEGSGRAPGTQVWWVRLWGEFRYTGSVAGQIEVAAEHQTVYDARTGDLLGRRTSPAVP